MKLKDFYHTSSDYSTDKGREHDYINSYYDNLFSPLKDEKIKILEIGIYRGHSTRLWRNYFTNAELFTIENGIESGGRPIVDNVTQYWVDGYCQETLDLFNNDYFDFIIDDGPHTLESQIYSATYWIEKLKLGGTLIIEDVKESEHFVQLNEAANLNNQKGKLYDFRLNKGRSDDMIFEIIKE